MYVVPFLMGPPGIALLEGRGRDHRQQVRRPQHAHHDARRARSRWSTSAASDDFTRCLHSLGDLSPDRRFIMHFPERQHGVVDRVGLRRQRAARQEVHGAPPGQLAGAQGRLDGRAHADPRPREIRRGGCTTSPARSRRRAARPISRCWCRPRRMPGWKAATVGDDIAWLRPGADGRLWAVNPESRLLRRRARHQPQDQPERVRHDPAQHDLHERRAAARRHAVVGRARRSAAGRGASTGRAGRGRRRPARRRRIRTAASPTPATQCASLSPEFENPNGVPIDAMLFGARRQRRVPLVYEARSWQHGTFLGATLSSETTAAATGKVGVLRRDPMAMLAVLRLQHGRLLPALARRRRDAGEAAARSSASTGSAPAPTASSSGPASATTCACCKWILERCDGPRRRRSRRRSAPCRRWTRSTARACRLPTPTWRELLQASIRPSGSRRSPARRTDSACSAIALPAALHAEHDDLAQRIHDTMVFDPHHP